MGLIPSLAEAHKSPADTGSIILHISFKSNSSVLKQEALTEIKLFCTALKVSGKKYQILIYPGCDSNINEINSNEMCVLRSHAVKKQFISQGFDSTFIEEVFSKDKSKLSNDDNEEAEGEKDGIDIEAVPSKKDKKLNLAVSDLNTNREVGTQVFLQDLDFEGGKHELLPEFLPVLDTLVKILKANPTLEINIIGHVCCTAFGDDGLDVETKTKNLSYTRAKAVYKYLIRHHIREKRLSYTGTGGNNKLVLPEVSDQDKSLNRRVEIVVVKQ